MRLLVEDHQARRRGLGTVALATVATLTGPLGVQSASADDGNPTFQIGAGDYTQLRNAVRAMVDEGRDRRVPHTNLSSNGWRVVTGFCRPLRQPLPYGPVVDALGKVSPWLSDLPPTSGALAPLLPRPCCDRYHPGRTPTAPCSARPVTRCTTSAKRPSKLGHDRRARTYLPETQDLAGRADTGRSNVSPASGCCGSTGRPAGGPISKPSTTHWHAPTPMCGLSTSTARCAGAPRARPRPDLPHSRPLLRRGRARKPHVRGGREHDDRRRADRGHALPRRLSSRLGRRRCSSRHVAWTRYLGADLGPGAGRRRGRPGLRAS